MNLRKSTVAKSDEIKSKLKRREIESNKRKSRQLVKVANANQASIAEALELSKLAQSSQSSDTETEVEQNNQEEDEFWYDTSNIELSCTTSPVLEEPLSHRNPETWSHSN